ncbi:MAG: aquaporin [Thermoanaerobaculia bacterium]
MKNLHWREWLIEAGGLGLFMVSAGLFATLLFSPGSPVSHRIGSPLALRALMGLAMGATAAALIYSPWGRRSGAHFNPATTWTFYRLGKVAPVDAIAYPIAQFAGGLAGVVAVSLLVGRPFEERPVDWVATRPGQYGPGVAFAAEVAIAFILMTVVLEVSNRPRFARFTGMCAAALVFLDITFEAPLSGMSLNPARSLASIVPSMDFTGVWIYLTAPLLGMLGAAELYRRWPGIRPVLCAKLHHDDSSPCPFRCGFCRHETPRAEGASNSAQ